MSTRSKQSGPRKLIGQLMLDANIITEPQLKEALQVQERDGIKVVEALILLGYIDADRFVSFMAQQPGVASIDLTGYEAPQDLVDLVPRELAVKYEVFPIDRLSNLLTLGMVCPLDSKAIETLESTTGLRIKPLLCSPDDIRSAIKRYYPETKGEGPAEYRPQGFDAPAAPAAQETGTLTSSMRLQNIVPMIRRISSLPTLPQTVERVRAAVQDPEVSLQDVAGIIEMDPPIAAKMLSVANSAAFGFPHKVDRIDRAVSLLGLREAYSIVLGASVINLFEESPALDYERFWADSLLCATAMRVVAKRLSPSNGVSQLVSIGLLLGVGRIALAEVAPERYAKVPRSVRGNELIEEELKACAIAYPEAGYELAVHWALPDDMANCIRFHHAPELAAEPREHAALANLAWLVANPDLDETALSEQAANALGILGQSAGVLPELMADFQQARDESR